jgi:hypothetical protein
MSTHPPPPTRGGDPLRGMYLIASVLIAAACVVVVVVMLIPRGTTASTSRDSWVPGSLPAYEPPAGTSPAVELPAEVREELHHH